MFFSKKIIGRTLFLFCVFTFRLHADFYDFPLFEVTPTDDANTITLIRRSSFNHAKIVETKVLSVDEALDLSVRKGSLPVLKQTLLKCVALKKTVFLEEILGLQLLSLCYTRAKKRLDGVLVGSVTVGLAAAAVLDAVASIRSMPNKWEKCLMNASFSFVSALIFTAFWMDAQEETKNIIACIKEVLLDANLPIRDRAKAVCVLESLRKEFSAVDRHLVDEKLKAMK